MKNSADTEKKKKKKIMGHGSIILFLENSPGYVIALAYHLHLMYCTGIYNKKSRPQLSTSTVKPSKWNQEKEHS